MEEQITKCIFFGRKLPPCQWRHTINDIPMCWNCTNECIYLKKNKDTETIHLGDGSGK